jgi:hypothetical protein
MNKAQELIALANTFVGTKEENGDNSGKMVELFQRSVDGVANRESWCMCFVQFCVKQIEKKHTVKGNLFKSEHCLTVWNKTPKEFRLTEPEVGCVVIWQFGNTDSGHTGIVTKLTGSRIETIEGNTSGPSKDVVREGDEVAIKSRSKTGTKAMRVVGFIKVF